MRTFVKVTDDDRSVTVNALFPSDQNVVIAHTVRVRNGGAPDRVGIALSPIEALAMAAALIERAGTIIARSAEQDAQDAERELVLQAHEASLRAAGIEL